ncbi:hypothetical protein GCM10020000_64690 [Streptomyces olivoverticillatus]
MWHDASTPRSHSSHRSQRACSQPAGHESLPHTRPRPVHWLATAAALAALITGAALLGPGDTTATATTAESAEAPDARTARYPVDCGGTSTEIVKQAPADLDGDGRPETAAVVRCASGAGTRPSGLYVLAPPTAGEAHPACWRPSSTRGRR